MKSQHFFGWNVVAAAGLGLAVSFSTYQTSMFGLLARPVGAEFGWSRSEAALAITISNWALVAVAPVLGWGIDRYGPRRLILASTVAFAGAMLALAAQPGQLWAFYALHLLLSLAGAGTLPPTYTRVVVAWFDRRRGLALGLALAGVGIGNIVLPPLLQYAVGAFGWRGAYVTVALLAALVVLPVVAVLLRQDPAAMGLSPDGQDAGVRPRAAAPGLTMPEAVRSRAFWLLIAIFVALGVMSLGIAVNVVPLLTDRGMPPVQAAGMASVLGLGLLAGRLASGLLLDRFPAPAVAFGCLAMPALGLAGLAADGSADTSVVGACLFLIGFGIGAEFDFLSFFISRYIGLRVYGKVYGWTYAAFQVGCGVGPLMMGIVFDRTRSYDAGLWALAGCCLVAAALFSAFGPYPRFGSPAGAGDLGPAAPAVRG